MNKKYTTGELTEALRAISSIISKLEKVQPKLKGKSQLTLLNNRLKALHIASSLINSSLDSHEKPLDH